MRPVQSHAEFRAQVYAEHLITVRLCSTKVKIAVGTLNMHTHSQQHMCQSHTVGTARQGHYVLCAM